MLKAVQRQWQFRLRLLPLAIAAIVIATFLPIELRAPRWGDAAFDLLDFVENLLLYAPLGIALAARRRWQILGVALILSAVAETVQLCSFERYSSLYDVISNGLGALLGAWSWQHYTHCSLHDTDVHVNQHWLLAVAAMCAGLLAVWHLPTDSAALADWDANYALLMGNESTGDRPWQGTTYGLTLLSGALSSKEIVDLGGVNIAAKPALKRRLLYSDTTTLSLQGEAPRRLPQEVAKRLVKTVNAHGAFTVIADVSTASLDQEGPARIVSFSDGTLLRNFDLGQERQGIAFRVRTQVSGKNGEDFRAETPAVLQQGVRRLVVATYDGAIARIYVDGAAAARSNIAAAGCVNRALCDSGVPIAWSVLGGSFAMFALALALAPWRRRAQIMVVTALAGVAALWLPQLFHLVPAPVLGHPWMPGVALLAALIVGAACREEAAKQGSG